MNGARTPMGRFSDRTSAGRALGEELARGGLDAPVVLALPRGGVPVAVQVARALHAPWEVFIVRKLGVPYQPEVGMGALAEDGTLVLDRATVLAAGVDHAGLERVIQTERAEARRRVEAYRGGRALPDLRGREVVVVDDGVATGVTARAALRAVRAAGARRVVLAVPVVAAGVVPELLSECDAVVALRQPVDLLAVGAWYDDFEQVRDEAVLAALAPGPGDVAAGPGRAVRGAGSW